MGVDRDLFHVMYCTDSLVMDSLNVTLRGTASSSDFGILYLRIEGCVNGSSSDTCAP